MLSCRMFGEGELDPQVCSSLAAGGCCGDGPPERYIPKWNAAAVKVGWEPDLDPSTAITYSFEKEWVGAPPRLYEWYGPAGEECKILWDDLADQERKTFMDKFSEIEGVSSHPTLKKYVGNGRCSMQTPTDEHVWLPLKRNGNAPDSISKFIEFDSGPWEIKAAAFYYDLEDMKRVVEAMWPYVDVPRDGDVPGFPTERRIQIHVVAPLKVDSYGGGDSASPAERFSTNYPLMHRNFRLIQAYYSDFMFLRLIFPLGPNRQPCRDHSSGELFKCDILTDDNNAPILEVSPESEWYEHDHKEEIVGIRESSTYTDAEDAGPQLFRVGFEIRKSESFDQAVDIAGAIALSISSMTEDGDATVGITRTVRIHTVMEFAQHHRKKRNDHTFCQGIPKFTGWDSVMMDLLVSATGKDNDWLKLWHFLRLLLCSDWTKLLDLDVPSIESSRKELLNDLDRFFSAREGKKQIMDDFFRKASQYAFELSQSF